MEKSYLDRRSFIGLSGVGLAGVLVGCGTAAAETGGAAATTSKSDGPDPNPVGLVVRGAVRYAPGPPTVPSLSPIGLAALLLLVLTVTWQCVGRVKLPGPAASR